ncbi:MAG: DUF262 domain-containing protein [Bacteroidales bacterium]|nr:DUF262 domain-containing protein [Bacteroidales bacterium]
MAENDNNITENNNIDLKAISELKGYKFVIPYQQRGYKWTPDNVRILLQDIKDFIDEGDRKPLYCLQPIALVPDCSKKYKVIDGQQRLTTLYLLWKYLFKGDKDENLYNFDYERDGNDERPDFLKAIHNIERENEDNIDFFFISRAYLTIKEWFHDREVYTLLEDEDRCVLQGDGNIDNVRKQFKELLLRNKDEKSIQVLWYIVEGDEHEAFRNLNSGKIELSNSDLIKALLLDKTNDLDNRQQIAAQFELMERQLKEDRFWYMFQQKDVEPEKGQSRMDFLFNMIAGVSNDDYQIDSRKSFFRFSNYEKNELSNMWKEVRQKYQRLRDLFENPYTFHYIGFLTYCDKKMDSILEDYESQKKSDYIDGLKIQIQEIMPFKKDSLDDCSFDDAKKHLRRLFVLHNIETLLQRYCELKDKKNLRFTYEHFPFELLYKQKWNIEHIDSQTKNDLTKAQDREDWIGSIKDDFPEISNDEEIIDLEKKCGDYTDDENFSELYEKVIKKINVELIDDKDGIGNLVLLDEHTNKSFHNALFPRKRRIVIMASGLKNDNDIEKNVESVYVPVCTQQVYTKSYTKERGIKLTWWEKYDYDAYVTDMHEKLDYYFKQK